MPTYEELQAEVTKLRAENLALNAQNIYLGRALRITVEGINQANMSVAATVLHLNELNAELAAKEAVEPLMTMLPQPVNIQ